MKTKPMKNCRKEMVIEHHNKTIYDCKNVTKLHCTTLWTVNDQGEKVHSLQQSYQYQYLSSLSAGVVWQ